jgi:hypothetical protein
MSSSLVSLYHPSNIPFSNNDNPERLLLAVWLVRLFSVKQLEQSTKDIGPSLDSEKRENVMERLEKVYTARKSEENFEKGERGKHTNHVARVLLIAMLDWDSEVAIEVTNPKNRLSKPIRHPEVPKFVCDSGLIRQIPTNGDSPPIFPMDLSKTLKPFVASQSSAEISTTASPKSDQLHPTTMSMPRRPRAVNFSRMRQIKHGSNAVAEDKSVPGIPPLSYESYGGDGRYAGFSAPAYPPVGVSHLHRASPLSSDSLNLIFNSSKSCVALSATTPKQTQVVPQASGSGPPFGNSAFGQSCNLDGYSTYSQPNQATTLFEGRTSWPDNPGKSTGENLESHAFGPLDPEASLLKGRTIWPDNGMLGNRELCSYGSQDLKESFCKDSFWAFSTCDDTREYPGFPSQAIHSGNHLDYDLEEQPLHSGRLHDFRSMPTDFLFQ